MVAVAGAVTRRLQARSMAERYRLSTDPGRSARSCSRPPRRRAPLRLAAAAARRPLPRRAGASDRRGTTPEERRGWTPPGRAGVATGRRPGRQAAAGDGAGGRVSERGECRSVLPPFTPCPPPTRHPFISLTLHNLPSTLLPPQHPLLLPPLCLSPHFRVV